MDPFERKYTVISLRLQKRNRIYLRRICYLRNFLNLLRIYRVYLYWKYGRRRWMKSITWHKYDSIMWKMYTLHFNRVFEFLEEHTVVLYRYYNFRVEATRLISKKPFQFITILDTLSIDKMTIISLRHETACWKKYLVALSRCKY